jgi:hypothetical protein
MTGKPQEAPKTRGQGVQVHFSAAEDKQGIGAIVQFIWSIVTTMQNWRNNLLATALGYRDRIVHISLAGNEGGLNLTSAYRGPVASLSFGSRRSAQSLAPYPQSSKSGDVVMRQVPK